MSRPALLCCRQIRLSYDTMALVDISPRKLAFKIIECCKEIIRSLANKFFRKVHRLDFLSLALHFGDIVDKPVHSLELVVQLALHCSNDLWVSSEKHDLHEDCCNLTLRVEFLDSVNVVISVGKYCLVSILQNRAEISTGSFGNEVNGRMVSLCLGISGECI